MYDQRTVERFNAKVESADANGCQPWMGARKRDGYGNFFAAGRSVIAHRFAWELVHGEIPAGYQVHHTCKRPDCVNILHLKLVSSVEHGEAHRGEARAAMVKRDHRGELRGIRVRPSRTAGGKPSYEAWVYDGRTGQKVRRTFPTLSAAKGWRRDAVATLRVSPEKMPAQTKRTLRDAAEAWIEGAKRNEILTRSGRPYKPSALRGYEASLNQYVLDDLGAVRLSELRRRDLQALVDRLVGKGLSGSRVRNVIIAVRAICRHALERDELTVNPTANLRLPAVGGRRERVASPEEAARLLAALPESDQALWACAFYGGLRLGELRALACDHVDLKSNEISVSRSWDPKEGFIGPKSEKGARTVPIPAILKRHLAEHLARTGRRGSDLIFGRTGSAPFTQTWIRKRALRSWANRYACGCVIANDGPKECVQHKAGRMVPIGLHEARHTYVSLMYAAGVPLEEIGDYVGHAGAYMTERYRHLLPSSGADAAAKLDRFLGVS